MKTMGKMAPGFLTMLLGLMILALNSQALAQGGSWATKAPMPTPRRNMGAGAIDGKIYVTGGLIACDSSNVLEIYDPAADSWVTGAPLPTAGKIDAAAVLDGKLYVLMTQASCVGPTLQVMFAYDPATDTWAGKTVHPSYRQSYTAGVIGGKLFLAGGSPPGSAAFLDTLEEYDPVTDSWTTKASMPTPRQTVAGAVVGGKFYVIGGLQFCCASLATVEAYDPLTDTWESKAPLPAARNQAAAGVIDGKIYVAGGINEDGTSLATTSFAYDPTTDTWTAVAPIPTPRAGHAVVVTNGDLHVFGGDAAVSAGAPSHLVFTPVLQVAIDITPESFPNSININNKGQIPVAIPTTSTAQGEPLDFDATSVDATTVRFGRTGTEAAPVQSALEDVDGDGDTDLILHFNTQATGIVCGDTSASLTGKTFSAQAIQGSDSVQTVGCK